MALSVGSLHPHDAPLPVRADGVCGVLVAHASGRRAAVRGLRWPPLVRHDRTPQVSAVLGPTRQEVGGGSRARIDQWFPRGPLAGRQVRLHGRQYHTI